MPSGKKLVDQTPALPNRSVAFQAGRRRASLRNSLLPRPSDTASCPAAPPFEDNQRITPELIDEIESYTAFAPLHTPIAVYIMREALRLFPGVPNFAILDT